MVYRQAQANCKPAIGEWKTLLHRTLRDGLRAGNGLKRFHRRKKQWFTDKHRWTAKLAQVVGTFSSAGPHSLVQRTSQTGFVPCSQAHDVLLFRLCKQIYRTLNKNTAPPTPSKAHTHTHTHKHTHTDIHTHTNTQTYTHTHTHTHTHTPPQTHPHIHTHTQLCTPERTHLPSVLNLRMNSIG